MSDAVLDHLKAARPAFIERLAAFVACPSVGADPDYAEGMEAARRFLMTRLAEIGFDNIRTLTAGGQPAVAAEWMGAEGAPTLLVYGHYDVQPSAPDEKWHSDPWTLTERDGKIYGRGVSDDKAPSLIAIETLGAFLAVEGKLPVNVKILLEGEEEVGSATLRAILETYKDELQADAVLSADGARWRSDLETLVTSTRGNAGFEFSIKTADKDLHSGRYGGAVPNALPVMAKLLASLYDETGKIAVNGYFDGVTEPSEAERADLARIPFDADAAAAALGTVQAGEPGYTWLERNWLRPTLEINGMWGGYIGNGSKTVIPSEAHAKITMRLVPGQDPVHCIEATIAHLRANCPAGTELTIDGMRGHSCAYALPPDHPLLLAASDTIVETTGQLPVRIGIGATLPVASMMAEALGMDTVMFSYSTSDEDYHAPNEHFRCTSIDHGFEGWVSILRKVGTHDPAHYAEMKARRA